MSKSDVMTLMSMAATSIYAPYVDRFYHTEEPRRITEPIHKPITDGQKRIFAEPYRELKEFNINGTKIMAYSRKDAITRLKHKKK